MATIRLLDARRGLNRKCEELFGNAKIAEAIYRFLCNGIDDCEDVAQERKRGKWVIKDESYWRPHYSGDIPVNKAGLYCSECDKRLAKAQKYRNFCPNCGADMREETEDATN